MEKLVGPKLFASGATIYITNGCNFRCGHCCLGESGNMHMSPEDFAFILDKIENPFLDNITFYGGEARVHPQFTRLMMVAQHFFNERGTGFSSETESRQHAVRRHQMSEGMKGLNQQLSAQEINRLRSTGEWYAYTHALDKRLREDPQNRSVDIGIYTNGFGMDNPENCARILKQLYDLGIRKISVSEDPPHRAYAKQKGIEIDYDYILGMRSIFGFQREKSGIPKDMDINVSGTGRYVIPIRKARNLSWQKRIELGSPDSGFTSSISGIIVELNREFKDWSPASHSHCYCDLTRFYKRAEEESKKEPRYRFHGWHPTVNVNLESQFCMFGIMPGVGNYRDLELDEIYQRASHNRLYQILATDGPQGLARLLTPFYEDREDALLDWFLERTPCGLCEDLMAEYPAEIQKLVHTSAQV